MRASRWFWVPVLLVAIAAPAASGWAADRPAKAAKDDAKKAYKAAKRGYWQEAIALWESAGRLDPDNPEIANNHAVALEAIGRYEEAGGVYERALELAPNDRRIRKNYNLYKEFYTSYVIRQEDGAGDEGQRTEDDRDDQGTPGGDDVRP
jgi:tetratricopeptide (TPR) repeat protein